jgi:hypothetical protein
MYIRLPDAASSAHVIALGEQLHRCAIRPAMILEMQNFESFCDHDEGHAE